MHITLGMAKNAVKKFVHAEPDKIARCAWVDDQMVPACLVANALHDLGVSVKILADMAGPIVPAYLDGYLPGFTIDDDALEFFDNVQAWQDGRGSTIEGLGRETPKMNWLQAYRLADMNVFHPQIQRKKQNA